MRISPAHEIVQIPSAKKIRQRTTAPAVRYDIRMDADINKLVFFFPPSPGDISLKQPTGPVEVCNCTHILLLAVWMTRQSTSCSTSCLLFCR